MERIDGYGFFANHFLTLPGVDYVQNMRNYNFSEDTEAGSLFKSFFEANKELSDDELLEKINVERTYLFRGLSKEGPNPPYESVFRGAPQGNTVLDLRQFYNKAGVAVSENVHEPADYIGVELSFMQQLCLGESTEELQQEFFYKHLGIWGKELAAEILRHARSDFYGAMGNLLYDFLDEEEKLISSVVIGVKA